MSTLKVPNFLPQITRTVVPYLVGWLLSLPLVPKIEDLLGVAEADRSAWLARLLTVALGAVYYIVVAWIERHQSAFGWLLGVAKQPAYPVTPTTDDGLHAVPALPPTGAHPDAAGDAEDALDETAPDDAERGDGELATIFYVLGSLAFLVFIANVAYVRFH